jgi:hypothetical protein
LAIDAEVLLLFPHLIDQMTFFLFVSARPIVFITVLLPASRTPIILSLPFVTDLKVLLLNILLMVVLRHSPRPTDGQCLILLQDLKCHHPQLLLDQSSRPITALIVRGD